MSAVDRLADRLEDVSAREAAKGGLHAKIADELADDAVLLRRLKPSLMVKRARGELPTSQQPGAPQRAPTGPQLGARPRPRRGNGPSPWLVLGAAVALGILAAKVIDWRSHAHPRD